MKYYNRFQPCFFVLLFCFVVSCKKENVTTGTQKEQPLIPLSKGDSYKPTILGVQYPNPFDVDMMRKAYSSLTGIKCALEPTHKYVRFLPATQKQYHQLLDDEAMELYTIPLDYEIREIGDYYIEPGLDKDQITWQYTVVPIDYILPSGIQVEILSELFLPDSENIYECTTDISIDSLELTAFTLCGIPEEYYDADTHHNRPVGSTPQGDITVENTTLNTNVGLRNVKVKYRRWFNFGHTFTDGSGHFVANRSYNGKVHVELEFESSRAKIKGIIGYKVPSSLADNIDIPVGEFKGTSITNIQFNIPNSNDTGSIASQRWHAAMVCNSLEETHQFCNQDGILTPPNNLNIWLTTGHADGLMGANPMFKQRANSSSMTDGFLSHYLIGSGLPIFQIVKTILQQYLPDVIINYAETKQSDIVQHLVFHELGHAIHYIKVGNLFWASTVSRETSNIVNTRTAPSGPDPYDSLHPNDPLNDQIQLCEGFAEYIGDRYTHKRYGNALGGNNFWLNKLEIFKPKPKQYPKDCGGAMLDLIDNGEPVSTGINDEVNGYTPAQVVQALTHSTTSVALYKNSLLLISNNLQQTQVNQLFTSYGF